MCGPNSPLPSTSQLSGWISENPPAKNTKLAAKTTGTLSGQVDEKIICSALTYFNFQGPVVQSIVCLTKLFIKDLLSLTAHTKSNQVIFFAEKNVRSFCSAKAPHIFSAKNGSVFAYNTFEISTSC